MACAVQRCVQSVGKCTILMPGPFEAWQASAHALAAGMEANVIDDHGRVLNADAFTAIGGELGQLYAALEGRDLAAGSAAARRLFS